MSRRPEVAAVDDYDSDNSSVKPGTRREARRRQTTSGPPRAIDRYRKSNRDGASDSGYSSRTTNTQESSASATAAADAAAMPPPPRPAPVDQPSRSRPVVHRSDSQSSRPRAPSRSGSASRTSGVCGDPNCVDPNCLNSRRRYSAGYTTTAQGVAAQSAPLPMQYQVSPQYAYAPPQAVPISIPQSVPYPSSHPRPRSGSATRQSRPASMSEYWPASYDARQPGPPPANSAYHNNLASQWAQSPYFHLYQQQQQQAAQQQQAYLAAYGTTPPSQTTPLYTPQTPTAPSPTSPAFAAAPLLARTYSARAASANIAPAYDTMNVRYSSRPSRTISARHAGGRTSTIPGAFPTGEDESSETSSASEDSEPEYEYTHRARARDSRLMSSSSQRRPSMNKQYISAPAVPTQSSRDFLRRNPRSDTAIEYVSSDNMDSDRTARAVVDRARTQYTGSTHSSRRPSQSTNASSRTKSTNMSSLASGMASMTVEDRKGRKVDYLSQRDQERLYREQRRRQEMSEEYQDAMRGHQAPNLTTANIHSIQQRGNAPSVSGQSRRSSKSKGSASGIKIESGGTIIHVYGEERVEVQTGEDGAQRVVVGGSGGGTRSGDTSYHGSKSSSSRVGRSRGGSEANTSKKRSSKIREAREDSD